MPITPGERLARVLDGSQAPGAFSAQLSVPARDVRLTVAGAGPISFPVKAPQAKRMIACARPARFGRGEQTLMDLSVRDTWEIAPDRVTLTGLDWDAILTVVRDELGLPARARLRAGPHALLVYGKGQFFLPHQDSEKDDTMIGTLVVSLPSSHTGGELLIEHNGKTVAYQASATEVSVAAFYADCRHEVKPVRTGYRVTLTCNLLLDSDPAGQVPVEPSAEAARYLTEHFTTRVSRWKGDDREPPNRLVYLLDHEYTQRGLSWDRLKGTDAERAALLRSAAADAGCEAVLALTEIKETWDTEPGRRGRGVDLTYIITSELTICWWTGMPGGEPISLYVPDEQVCASTPSADRCRTSSTRGGGCSAPGRFASASFRPSRRTAGPPMRPKRSAKKSGASCRGRWTTSAQRAADRSAELPNRDTTDLQLFFPLESHSSRLSRTEAPPSTPPQSTGKRRISSHDQTPPPRARRDARRPRPRPRRAGREGDLHVRQGPLRVRLQGPLFRLEGRRPLHEVRRHDQNRPREPRGELGKTEDRSREHRHRQPGPREAPQLARLLRHLEVSRDHVQLHDDRREVEGRVRGDGQPHGKGRHEARRPDRGGERIRERRPRRPKGRIRRHGEDQPQGFRRELEQHGRRERDARG